MSATRVAALAALCLIFGSAARAQQPEAHSPAPKVSESPPPSATGCLPGGNGFLRARIRGALNLDIYWRDAELECEGGARPDRSGLRVSFAGPRRSDGRRLRMVFGVRIAEGVSGSAVPTNLTVIFEGEQRLFATQGDERCTVDKLTQERLGALGGPVRSYRVVARGFCTAPATTLSGDERIFVDSFDFAGHVTIDDNDLPPPPGETAVKQP